MRVGRLNTILTVHSPRMSVKRYNQQPFDSVTVQQVVVTSQ